LLGAALSVKARKDHVKENEMFQRVGRLTGKFAECPGCTSIKTINPETLAGLNGTLVPTPARPLSAPHPQKHLRAASDSKWTGSRI